MLQFMRSAGLCLLRAPALPNPLRQPDPRGRDLLVLQGGLALLLSRCPQPLARSRFPHAVAVHAQLAGARPGRAVALDARQLNELAHEIAEHVDPYTRAAAVRCVLACATSARGVPSGALGQAAA